MNYLFTKHRVPRGARADAETDDAIILIKKVAELRATYQIRLLAYRASQIGKTLVIEVPKECTIHRSLQNLLHRTQDVEIVRN